MFSFISQTEVVFVMKADIVIVVVFAFLRDEEFSAEHSLAGISVE